MPNKVVRKIRFNNTLTKKENNKHLSIDQLNQKGKIRY